MKNKLKNMAKDEIKKEDVKCACGDNHPCGDNCECDHDEHEHACCDDNCSSCEDGCCEDGCCEDGCCEDEDFAHGYGENGLHHGRGRHCGKMILVVIGILALTGIIIVSMLRDKIMSPQYRSVTVIGQGRVNYQPDIAVLNLGVQIDKAASAEEALNQLNSKMTAIVKAVQEMGVNEADIQTQNYSLYPQYDYKDNISVVAGYNANQQVIIKVLAYDKDPERLSRVIGAASKAGVNQVNSLSFDASNMNDLKQEAKLQAIKDAKERGQVLADAAGVELKDITSWYENYMGPSPIYMDYGAKGGMGAGAESFSAAVPSGSREVVIEMNITYNIK